jgi:glycerate 2-kinase
MPDARNLLKEFFFHAVDEVRAPARLTATLPPPPSGRTLVLAAGKAGGAMAASVEAAWNGPLSGIAVTPPGYEVPLKRIETMIAGHPFPDERSVIAASRFLEEARKLTAADLALVLLSGGGSALLAMPAPGLTLEDKQAVTRALFAAGAGIGEINTVRKHLSAIKGGRLARAAAQARVVTRAISDVAGDDLGAIASGPTLGDASTAAEALAILRQHGIAAPNRVFERLEKAETETPEPDGPGVAAADVRIIASGADALAAAGARARALGFTVHDLGDRISGEAREVAREHAARALSLVTQGGRHVILSGGEVTVTLGAACGQGGPNREYALALALYLGGHRGMAALAADTDGIDGSGSAAGAFVLPDTPERAQAANLDAAAMLDGHDSGAFFDRLGDSFVTGPTRTNVNDFRAIVVDGAIDA